MAEFLILLGKVNLAMCAAILVVYMLRRPTRAAFHAPIAYRLWLLVPVAALASLLPSRAVVGSVKEVSFPIGTGTMLPTYRITCHRIGCCSSLRLGWSAPVEWCYI
jgi:beta-lactamase regulating signal transducer with metallopeptidase domain